MRGVPEPLPEGCILVCIYVHTMWYEDHCIIL
jgi:hypothetical protein